MKDLARWTVTALVIAALAAAVRFEIPPTEAAPVLNIAGDPLELDGNAVTAGTHDWDKIFAGISGATASAFVADAVNSPNDDIFKASSKESQGIQQGPWLFTAGKPGSPYDI